MKEVKFDKKDYIEDSLLNEKTLEFIRVQHEHYWGSANIELITRHKKINKYEVDVAIVLKLKSYRRLIGIELKEYNFIDVISQAIERRPYFHYLYIITRPPRRTMGFWIKDLISGKQNADLDKLKKLFKNKIGWICVDEYKGTFLLLPSFFQKCDVKYLLDLNGHLTDFEIGKKNLKRVI